MPVKRSNKPKEANGGGKKSWKKPGKIGGKQQEQLETKTKGPSTLKLSKGESPVLVVTLKEGESIVANGGAMLYMKGEVDIDRIAIEPESNNNKSRSFFRGIGRILAGQSMFQSVFTGVGVVALASPLPGEMTEITIHPGEKFLVNRSAFVCCDPWVRVSAAFLGIGLLGVGQDEGFIVPTVEVPEGREPGRVWIASFGSHTEHTLTKAQMDKKMTIRVDNGAWLMSDSRWSVVAASQKGTISNRFFRSVFSGEGMVMRFPSDRKEDNTKDGIRVWTQSRNISDLAHRVGDYLEMSGRMCCKKDSLFDD
jgi:uncharacterized protein (AIM24 family)